MPAHVANTRLDTIERAANRLPEEARSGSTATSVSGQVPTGQPAMMSGASCDCGAVGLSACSRVNTTSALCGESFCSCIGYQDDGMILMGSSFSRTHPLTSGAKRAILNLPLASSFKITNLPSFGAVTMGWGSRLLLVCGEVERFIATAT